MVLLAAMVLQVNAASQTVRVTVDCGRGRLDGAERETCRSPDLIRLTEDVDRMTARLQDVFTGYEKEALVDTEGPLRVQRNNCQNAGVGAHECIDRVLRERLQALQLAATSPASIFDELGKYEFLSIGYFMMWGSRLLGKRVSVWGCMTLDPGATAAARIYGTIHDCSPNTKGPSVPAAFKSMTDDRAKWFYDAKEPTTYWRGVVEQRDGRLVLAEIEP